MQALCAIARKRHCARIRKVDVHCRSNFGRCRHGSCRRGPQVAGTVALRHFGESHRKRITWLSTPLVIETKPLLEPSTSQAAHGPGSPRCCRASAGFGSGRANCQDRPITLATKSWATPLPPRPCLSCYYGAAAPSAAEDFKTSRRLACLNGMVSRWRGRAGPLLQRVMRAATGSRAARPSSRQCCGWLGGASARGLDVLLLRLWRNQHHPTALFSPK